MDDHKKTYSLCAVLKELGEVLFETRIPADSDLIIKFIENEKSFINQPDADIKSSYEWGCIGYFLYWKLAERGIDCDTLAPSIVQRSAKNKGVKNDRRDSRNIAITAIARELSCFVKGVETSHLE